MYAGHLGFALGTHSFRRTIPLWLLLVAAQLPDWFDAGMCIVNHDRGPWGLYTHGFYTIGGAAVILAVLYALSARDMIGGLLVALTVVSHYALDYFTGSKPTWPGGPIIGLRLYDRPIIDLVLESLTILIGWTLYRRALSKEGRDDRHTYIMLAGLLLLQLGAGLAFYWKLGGQVKC